MKNSKYQMLFHEHNHSGSLSSITLNSSDFDFNDDESGCYDPHEFILDNQFLDGVSVIDDSSVPLNTQLQKATFPPMRRRSGSGSAISFKSLPGISTENNSSAVTRHDNLGLSQPMDLSPKLLHTALPLPRASKAQTNRTHLRAKSLNSTAMARSAKTKNRTHSRGTTFGSLEYSGSFLHDISVRDSLICDAFSLKFSVVS